VESCSSSLLSLYIYGQCADLWGSTAVIDFHLKKKNELLNHILKQIQISIIKQVNESFEIKSETAFQGYTAQRMALEPRD